LVTPFVDPSAQPIIDDGDKYCQPDSKGNFDGTSTSVDSGTLPNSDAWAEGGGCVLQPIRQVWAVLNNVDGLKWAAADKITYTRTVNPKPGFTHLYEIVYYKSTLIGEINWTIDWYHAVSAGTYKSPTQVSINYQRTAGTSMIPVWQGGIVLNKITDKVTSIAVRNQFRARQSSSDNEASARSALSEIVDDSRKLTPDWDKLDITK